MFGSPQHTGPFGPPQVPQSPPLGFGSSQQGQQANPFGGGPPQQGQHTVHAQHHTQSHFGSGSPQQSHPANSFGGCTPPSQQPSPFGTPHAQHHSHQGQFGVSPPSSPLQGQGDGQQVQTHQGHPFGGNPSQQYGHYDGRYGFGNGGNKTSPPPSPFGTSQALHHSHQVHFGNGHQHFGPHQVYGAGQHSVPHQAASGMFAGGGQSSPPSQQGHHFGPAGPYLPPHEQPGHVNPPHPGEHGYVPRGGVHPQLFGHHQQFGQQQAYGGGGQLAFGQKTPQQQQSPFAMGGSPAKLGQQVGGASPADKSLIGYNGPMKQCVQCGQALRIYYKFCQACNKSQPPRQAATQVLDPDLRPSPFVPATPKKDIEYVAGYDEMGNPTNFLPAGERPRAPGVYHAQDQDRPTTSQTQDHQSHYQHRSLLQQIESSLNPETYIPCALTYPVTTRARHIENFLETEKAKSVQRGKIKEWIIEADARCEARMLVAWKARKQLEAALANENGQSPPLRSKLAQVLDSDTVELIIKARGNTPASVRLPEEIKISSGSDEEMSALEIDDEEFTAAFENGEEGMNAVKQSVRPKVRLRGKQAVGPPSVAPMRPAKRSTKSQRKAERKRQQEGETF